MWNYFVDRSIGLAKPNRPVDPATVQSMRETMYVCTYLFDLLSGKAHHPTTPRLSTTCQKTSQEGAGVKVFKIILAFNIGSIFFYYAYGITIVGGGAGQWEILAKLLPIIALCRGNIDNAVDKKRKEKFLCRGYVCT